MDETKDIAVTQAGAVIDEKKIDEYLEAFGLVKSLKPNEIKIFKEIAVAYQLNPFKREVYCVAYEGKKGRQLSIITGYEVYLKRASRVGTLDGWNVTTEGTRSTGTLKAVVTIHRKDWKKPFVHEAYWLEYNSNNQMWNSKPVTMLKKVCIAQAFRMCFPDEFTGMPYTSDELPDEMTQVKDVTPEESIKEGAPATVNDVKETFGGEVVGGDLF